MSTDLQDALDRSFGTGPQHPPVAEQVAVGRRALRRRRALAAAVAAGALVIAGTTYAVATAGPSAGPETPVASVPDPSAVDRDGWRAGETVRYVDGELELRPGVTVNERRTNPLGYLPPATSDGLDLTYRGTRRWVLTESSDTGTGLVESLPSDTWASFDAWIADQVAAARGGPHGSGWPTTMRLTDDGRVVAADGAQVLQRTDDPHLSAAFAPPGARTGAALIDLAGRSRFFVLWRVVDGELAQVVTPPSEAVGATWEELLSAARALYASREGSP